MEKVTENWMIKDIEAEGFQNNAGQLVNFAPWQQFKAMYDTYARMAELNINPPVVLMDSKDVLSKVVSEYTDKLMKLDFILFKWQISAWTGWVCAGILIILTLIPKGG